MQWFGANPIAEVWTTKPFQLPGFSYERMMRGTGFLRVIGRMKPGITVEQVRAALPSLEQDYRAISEQDRQHGQHIGQNAATGCDWKTFAPASRRFCCGVLCVADRVQQRCKSVARPLQRPASRDRAANGDRRIAQQHRAALRLGKFAGERLFAGALGAFVAWRLVPLVPKMASNFLPLEAKRGQQSLSFRCSVSRLHCRS